MQVYKGDEITIDGLEFICICSVCPEAYDVYTEDGCEITAYVKIRYGKIRCWHGETAASELIYEHQLEELQGAFYKHEERITHLTAIAKIINERLK